MEDTMNLENNCLQKTIIHFVGSKNNLDPLHLSNNALELDDENNRILQESFLSRFRTNREYHSFHHPSSLEFNEVYQYCRQLFNDGASGFEDISASIAKHLYEQSTHPKVKGGELYLAYFEGLPVDSRMYKAIGLFKTENKSIFLDVQKKKHQLDLHMKEGVEINKIDKGCLIINNNEEAGFDVLLFDNQNRGEEAQYWKEKFLSVVPQQNEFHHTAHFMNLTKQFITDQLETELKIPRTEQVELLHKSLDYFKSNEAFDIDEFQSQVFQNPEMIESFRRFGTQYVENTAYDIASQFDISPDAVKKQSRVYKSVLKLDKNFHIYIHGRTDLIQQGMDMDGRKYYKIYYNEEA
jgi:hypothetical protein